MRATTSSIPACVMQFVNTNGFVPRIVRESLWDSHERKRLYEEAVSFLRLRVERWKWARKGPQKKTIVAVPPVNSGSGVGVASQS